MYITIADDPPYSETENCYVDYEILENGDILHIWNINDHYYFDTNTGIQFSNHYKQQWTHNVLMLGYYNNDEWNLIYRVDKLSGFNKDLEVTDDYIQATLWKDLSYSGYNFRLAIRYYLGACDHNLTVIPYIKNLGIPIPFTLAFGWEMKNIKIGNIYQDNQIEINNTRYNLNDEHNLVFRNVNDTIFSLLNPNYYLYLDWNDNLNYLVTVKHRNGQFNCPVTLFIKIGTLDADEEKFTELYWYDSSLTLRPDANGSNIILIPSAGSNYACVDDVVNDNDATYVYKTYNNRWDLETYSFGDHAVTVDGSIDNVTLYLRCRSTNVGAATNAILKHVVYIGGTSYYGSAVNFGNVGAYTLYGYKWLTNPDTGTTWEWDDIDDVEAGIYLYSNNNANPRMTQCYMTINYTGLPIVTTNTSTGVEEANATVHGYVLFNNSDGNCTVRFQYGTTTAYGTNTTNQTITTITNFNANIMGLNPGTLYHYRSFINDSSSNENWGDDMTFYTKPEGPTSPHAYSISNNSTALIWTKGTGATNTVILRNESGWNGFPSGVTNGTIIYNSTGSSYYDGVDPGYNISYSLWSWTGDKHSDNYTTTYNISYPQAPYNTAGNQYSGNLNITWHKGAGADTTILVGNSSGIPTTPTDGTVLQNNSNSYYNNTLVASYHYTLFSYNNTLNVYSTGVAFEWGSLVINCYDENTSASIGFDVLISNEDGSQTYESLGNYNPLVIDVTICPNGADIHLLISNISYESRSYVMDLYESIQYILDTYLIRINQSELYQLNVIDEVDNAVEDAKMEIKRYINDTVGWEDVAIIYTDANGYVEIYLQPGELYKVAITKDGYQDETANYIPSDLIFTKTFKLLYSKSTPSPDEVIPEQVIFEGYINNNTAILLVNYSDAMEQTINTTIVVWEVNYSTYTTTTYATYSNSGNNDYSWSTSVNRSNAYVVILYFNHSTWGFQTKTLTFRPSEQTTITDQDTGEGILGSNLTMFLFFAVCVFGFGRRGAGIGLIMTGGLFLFIGNIIGFNTTLLSIAGGTLPILFIIIGIMMLWRDSKREAIS